MSLITWVKHEGTGRLGAMARPGRNHSLEEDLREARDKGVDVIVSTLTEQEIRDCKLESEHDVCEQLGIKYLWLPIKDHDVPPADRGTMDFLRARLHDLQSGKTIAVHCNQGRGRTTLIAASLLVMEGCDPDRAIQRVRGRRLVPVPDTKKQTEWIRDIGRHQQPRRRAIAQLEHSQSQQRRRRAIAVLGLAGIAAFAVYRHRARQS